MMKKSLLLGVILLVAGCSVDVVSDENLVVADIFESEKKDLEVVGKVELVEDENNFIARDILENSNDSFEDIGNETFIENEIPDLPAVVNGTGLDLVWSDEYLGVPLFSINYGAEDLVVVKMNSEVIFDSSFKVNDENSFGNFDIFPNNIDFTLGDNLIDVEYEDVADGEYVVIEIFKDSEAESSLLKWTAPDESGSLVIPIDFN